MFRGKLSCQLIIDSRMPVHDPPGSGSGYRFTIIIIIIILTTTICEIAQWLIWAKVGQRQVAANS